MPEALRAATEMTKSQHTNVVVIDLQTGAEADCASRPAMQSGLTERAWGFSDIVARIDQRAPKRSPRGSYKKSVDLDPRKEAT